MRYGNIHLIDDAQDVPHGERGTEFIDGIVFETNHILIVEYYLEIREDHFHLGII
jgi:hypothetical protein